MSYAQLRNQLARTLAKHPPKQKPIEETPVPSLYEFVRKAWHVIEPSKPFVDGPHIEALCLHLEAVTRGDIKRLLVNMPPRHAKSSIISVLWTVWTWLVNPSHRWLCASYALSLAIRDNRKCRMLIQSHWFQSRWGDKFKLSSDQNMKMKFENTASGYRQAVSVGSAATGEGGDTLLIDDPHSIDDKTSDVKREKALEWFKDTWSTRLNDQQTGAMVVVGQRIHEEDLSGYILSDASGEEWVHLNLPAEFEEGNASQSFVNGELFWEDWRKLEGELLWPERFPQKVLDIAKRKHGAMAYAALYQQRPVPAGGNKFKQIWFRYFVEEESFYGLDVLGGIRRVFKKECTTITTVDIAVSEKQTADYTVISTWAVTPSSEALLVDRVRGQFSNPEQVKQLRLCYQKHTPDYILIESVAYQLAIVQQLRAAGLPIMEYRPQKDKVSRATTASVFYEGSQVWHPKLAAWLPEWEGELLVFPKGKHDDQVDTVSMICDKIASGEFGNSDEAIELIGRFHNDSRMWGMTG